MRFLGPSYNDDLYILKDKMSRKQIKLKLKP